MNHQESIMNRFAVVYARVSTREQAQEGHSIVRQINMGVEHAKKLGFTRVKEIVDEGYSAKNFDRPGIKEVIKLIKCDLVSAVIIKDLDRLSRNQLLTLKFFALLEEHRVTLIGTNFNASRDSAHERMVSNIMSAVAQGESEITGERTIASIRGAYEKGYYPIKLKPFGYSKVDRHLYINDEEAEMVKEIFNFYAVYKLSTEQISMIMRVKNQKLVKKRIVSILRDRRYTGVIHYRGVDYYNIVPKIIDEKLFEFVQEMLSARFRIKKYTYHFATKIFCASCGKILNSVSAKPKDKPYLYYICENGDCKDHHKRISNVFLLKLFKVDILTIYNKKISNKQMFVSKGSDEFDNYEKQKAKEVYEIPIGELLELIVYDLPSYNFDLRTKKIVSKRYKVSNTFEESTL